MLCGEKLSIKTATNDPGIKILWTADTEYAEQEISTGYQPEYDILLINIFWGQEKESVFYIPLLTQKEILNNLGRRVYLSSSKGTNNRGIEIRREAIRHLKKDNNTLSFPVNWVTPNIQYSEPWDEWDKYWRDIP